MNGNVLLLNRFFTRNTFKEIVKNGESTTFCETKNRYELDRINLSNKETVEKIYKILKNDYQNEYYYKNTLLNKLLLGVHSLKTSTALTEIPVENSKADFIIINGKAVVYEIKTELDNFERLENQINDYYKAFKAVSVITSENQYYPIKKRINNTNVGIYILTSRGTISEKRKPKEIDIFLSHETIFKILRKSEYEDIILRYYKSLPNVSCFEYFEKCLDMFKKIPINDVYIDFIQILKQRSKKVNKDLFKKVPYELKFLVYFSNYSLNEYNNLFKFLNI